MSLENEIIDYPINEKNIKHWVYLKGEYRYETIIFFLKNNNIECNWKNVTYYIKYDKRLLINSFKYIVLLEEMYKSYLINSKEYKKERVLKCHFEQAYSCYLESNNEGYDELDLVTMKSEKDTINRFRNAVVHNQILIGSTFKGKTLEEVFKLFVKILPKSYRSGFIKDINSCSKGIVDDIWHINLSLEE